MYGNDKMYKRAQTKQELQSNWQKVSTTQTILLLELKF